MNGMPIDWAGLGRVMMSQNGWSEIVTLFFAWALAWLISRATRSWWPQSLATGPVRLEPDSAHRLMLPIVLLLIIGLARVATLRFHAAPLLTLALPLATAYAVQRLLLFLARHLMYPNPLPSKGERLIFWGTWLVVALYLSGLLPELLGALDEVKWVFDKRSMSLLQILESGFLALVVIFISLALSSLLEKQVMAAESVNSSVRVVITKFMRAMAMVIALLLVLHLVGIPLTLLSVFGGALGVGLGLGLQKIASNYVSGFIILLDRSLRIGDLVTVDNHQGVVAGIFSRYTLIRSIDGTESIIPNDTLITSTVVNHTHSAPEVTVTLQVSISYDSDVKQACDILLYAARQQSRVVAHPEPAALIKRLGDNGIDLELLAWIRDPEVGQGALRSAIYAVILDEFRKARIVIPFPQRELRWSEVGGVVGAVKPNSTGQWVQAKDQQSA